MTKKNKNLFLPLILVFILANGLTVLCSSPLASIHINSNVLIGAHCLLFIVSCTSVWMQLKSLRNKNPHAMVRSVMGSTMIKLFVLGAAAFIYLGAAGAHRNVNAIFAAMGLYIVYTWMEVRIVLKANANKNGAN